MPRRFGLEYVNTGGERRPIVMLHRALYGSIERFLGILLEHHGAALPGWLAPVQVAILPVGADQRPAASALAARLAAAGLRVRLDADDSLARRIAIAHDRGVAVAAVIGPREVANGTVALRRGAVRHAATLDAAVAELVAACAPPWGSG